MDHLDSSSVFSDCKEINWKYLFRKQNYVAIEVHLRSVQPAIEKLSLLCLKSVWSPLISSSTNDFFLSLKMNELLEWPVLNASPRITNTDHFVMSPNSFLPFFISTGWDYKYSICTYYSTHHCCIGIFTISLSFYFIHIYTYKSAFFRNGRCTRQKMSSLFRAFMFCL